MSKNKNFKTLVLLNDTTVRGNLKFLKGHQFDVLNDIVHLNGHLLPSDYQKVTLDWIKANPTLFFEDNRNY